jgi:hypothetical protein
MGDNDGERWLREHGFSAYETHWTRNGMCIWFDDAKGGWISWASRDAHETPLAAYRASLTYDRDNYLGLANQLERQLAIARDLASRRSEALLEAAGW